MTINGTIYYTFCASQLVDLCKTYLGGKLSENSVRNNFVLM